jgi:L-threonylcarbamoyladenylate synthase
MDMICGHRRRALQAHLKQGGVIAYATRAVFGLGCNPQSPRGIKRLLALKHRPKQKGLIVIAHEAGRLKRFHAKLSGEQNRQMLSRWPGNHTWLVPAHPHCPAHITGNRQPRQVALRVDDYPVTQTLLKSLGQPLISTSANRAGQRPAKTRREVLRRFGHLLRVLPGRTRRGEAPSRIENLAGGVVRR